MTLRTVSWCVEAICGTEGCLSSKWHHVREWWYQRDYCKEGYGSCYHVETELKDSRCKYERVLRVLPLLVRWAHRASTRDFCFALAALVRPAQNTISLQLSLSPSCWVGSRAVTPFSLYVSLVGTLLFIYRFYRNQPAYKVESTKTTCWVTLFLFSLQGGEGRRLWIWRRLFVGSRRVIIYARRLTAHTSMTIIRCKHETVLEEYIVTVNGDPIKMQSLIICPWYVHPSFVIQLWFLYSWTQHP